MKSKLIALAGCLLACAPSAADPAGMRTEPVRAAYADTIPGTLVSFVMVRLPGEPALWIGATEVTWDAYDVFAYRLDQPAGEAGSDAISRPSRPYGAPDYGWGHQGYPAISVAAPAAEAYAAWLSSVTGKRYRLPTDAEWSRAAAAGFGYAPVASARLDSVAWYAGNAGGRSHPVGSRAPDALGIYDLLGNAAEWVTGPDGRHLTRGGSWRDPPAEAHPGARAGYSTGWQERDPQYPKSRWWLSDAPFVGFRIVRE